MKCNSLLLAKNLLTVHTSKSKIKVTDFLRDMKCGRILATVQRARKSIEELL